MTAIAALMQGVALYVAGHRSEFDPANPGLFWGNALCDLLGGADYQRFAALKENGGTTMTVPEFGQFVDVRQFSDDELSQLRAVSNELDVVTSAIDAEYSSPEEMLQELVQGTDDWTVAMAIRALVDKPAPSVAMPDQKLMDALFLTAFYVLNAKGGLLDLTGVPRPWRSSSDGA